MERKTIHCDQCGVQLDYNIGLRNEIAGFSLSYGIEAKVLSPGLLPRVLLKVPTNTGSSNRSFSSIPIFENICSIDCLDEFYTKWFAEIRSNNSGNDAMRLWLAQRKAKKMIENR